MPAALRMPRLSWLAQGRAGAPPPPAPAPFPELPPFLQEAPRLPPPAQPRPSPGPGAAAAKPAGEVLPDSQE